MPAIPPSDDSGKVPEIDPIRPVRKITPGKALDPQSQKKAPPTPKQPPQPVYSLEHISPANAATLLSHPLMKNDEAKKNEKFIQLKKTLDKKRRGENPSIEENAVLKGVEQILDELKKPPYLVSIVENFRREVVAAGVKKDIILG